MRNGKYILVVAPDDYPGKKYRGRYCYEHHLVFWRKHRRLPQCGEVVHHDNTDPHDNVGKNLKLMGRGQHTRHHSRPRTLIELHCGHCGKCFTREARQVNTKRKVGQRIFFCSRSCAGKSVHRGRHARR
jgi:hypothetical protein